MTCQEKKNITSLPSSLAPGFRFHPTDDELVRYYLVRKVSGKNCGIDAISDADIYKMEPWDLPGLSKMRSRDLEWYFYSALDKKYGNGARMNRATNKGYWKATGNDRIVKHEDRVVGMKKTLVFHKGRAPGGKRTNWVMHEYRLVDEELERLGAVKDRYVLCRVFEKSGLGPPNGDQYASFDEREWDDEQVVAVPRVESIEEGLLSDQPKLEDGSTWEGNGLDEKNHAEDNLGSLGSLVCKNERLDTWSFPSIVRPKKPRYNTSDTTLPSDLSLSTKAALTEVHPAAMSASSLLDFPLSKTHGVKENPQLTPSNWFGNTTVHPSYLNLINNLQNEIHSVSEERDKLSTELMNAQDFIDVLQSRVNFLLEENEDLKRSGGNE